MADKKSETTPEILVELHRIDFLLTTLLKVQLAPIMQHELGDKTRAAIYEMTGTKSVKEISAALDIAVGTISQTWTRWEQIGIIYKDGRGYRKVFE